MRLSSGVATVLLLSSGAVALKAGIASVNSTVIPAAGARESITLNRGDTLQLRFSVQTDTVLKVVGSQLVAQGCGTGIVYLRTRRGTVYLSADTILVFVPCQNAPTPARITVCFPSPDSLLKYKVRGDTTVDPKLMGGDCT